MRIEDLEKYPFVTSRMLRGLEHEKHPEVTLTRKRDQLTRIEKGKYTVQENPLTYATVLVVPSYCSFRSALHHYQLTTQIPKKVQVVIQKRKKDLENIAFHTSPHMFGYTRTTIEGFDLFIADKEKLLLDCILYPQAGVMIDELQRLLEEPLNKQRIVEYLERIDNTSLTKRVGYLLEPRIDIHGEFRERIEADRNYPKLHIHLPRTGETNTKWRLLINDTQR